MIDADLNRKIRILLIFLEHPGGLGFNELAGIAHGLDICSRGTVSKILDELAAPPSPLIAKDEQGKYTLGLIGPISQIIREGSSRILEQTDKFLNILYETFDPSNKLQVELYYKIGSLFLSSKLNRTTLTTSFLVPFFYDDRIRTLWLYSQKFAFDTIYHKWDEMSEKFFKRKISHELEITPEMDGYISGRLKEINEQLTRCDNQVRNLILELSISDDSKRSMIRLIDSKPLTQLIAKEERSIAKPIHALREAKESVS